MKNLMPAFVFTLLILFSLPGLSAQSVKHHKKHHKRNATGRESRMRMQLRQGRIHEQQAKEADRVQQEVTKEQQ